MTFDHRQEIVEVVRDSTCQASQSFHLLGLPKLSFELLPFRLIPLQRAAHPVEGTRYLRQFISSPRLDRVCKIAFLECTHSFQKCCKRTRERIRDQVNQRSTRQHCHQAQSKKKLIEPLQVGCRLLVRFEDDEVRRRVRPWAKVQRTRQEPLTAQIDLFLCGLVLNLSQRFLLLKCGQGTHYDTFAITENNLARGDAAEFTCRSSVHGAAHHHHPLEIALDRGAIVKPLQDHLIDDSVVDPPCGRVALVQGAAKHFLGDRGGEYR